jgi:hypothetical protein
MARPKPLAELIDGCVGPAFAAQGFASADILAAWPEIVGDRLARVSRPQRIEWPRRARGADPKARPEPGTLMVRVEGAFALEFQHLAPLLVERLNAHYGWRCVGRVALRQGRVGAVARSRAAPPSLDPARRAEVREAVAAITQDDLREALDRLGTAVVAQQGRA